MIKQDERDFFIKDVAPHYENVVRFLNYLCGDTYLADDIAQDVMEDTLNSIGRVRTYSNIQAYLIDVAKKKWKRHCLKHKEWIPIGDMAIEIATDEILEESVIKNATSAELKKMLKLVDEKYSRVLILHYYYQMPLKEIASVYNENYSTIRSWHMRALQKMKIVATKMKENDTT
jgi:RNA polymerase sigma-70 factor (ECF subfamily)